MDDGRRCELALERWRRDLVEREAAPATVEKYVREARHLLDFLQERDLALDRAGVLAYKEELLRHRAPAGANSAIAAVNGFVSSCGLPALKLRRLRVQPMPRASARQLGAGEYRRLVAPGGPTSLELARLVARTLASTGIRASELASVSVEAVRAGCMVVTNKGRSRRVWLPRRLCERLRAWALRHGVRRGAVFVTATGRPLDRTQVWRLLKRLAASSGVDARKVFPHNLRHLFATAFYQKFHDMDAVGAILGHARLETTRAYLDEGDDLRRRQVESLGFA